MSSWSAFLCLCLMPSVSSEAYNKRQTADTDRGYIVDSRGWTHCITTINKYRYFSVQLKTKNKAFDSS